MLETFLLNFHNLIVDNLVVNKASETGLSLPA